MEHRLEEGGGEAGGAGELLAGEGAAVLPEEAGDAEAVGFGELGDGQMEEAQAFRMGLGPELLVGPDLEEGAGALSVLLGEVLLTDEEEGEVAARGAEEAMDLVQVDVAAGEQHAVGIDLPVGRQVDAGAEKGAPLLQRHIADPLRRNGGILLEEKAAHTPRVVLRKQGIAGVQRIPEHIDDLPRQLHIVEDRVRLDPDAFFHQLRSMRLAEVPREQTLHLGHKPMDVLGVPLPDQMEMGAHDHVTVHADMVLEGQYSNQIPPIDLVLVPLEQYGHPCPIGINVVAILDGMPLIRHIVLHHAHSFLQRWEIIARLSVFKRLSFNWLEISVLWLLFHAKVHHFCVK